MQAKREKRRLIIVEGIFALCRDELHIVFSLKPLKATKNFRNLFGLFKLESAIIVQKTDFSNGRLDLDLYDSVYIAAIVHDNEVSFVSHSPS